MTFPVLLQFFSEYALYSTFLNLLVIPLMSVLMAAGILCGAVGLLNLQAADCRDWSAMESCRSINRMGNLCLRLPGSVLTIGIPDPWKVLIYYLTLALALFFYIKRNSVRNTGESKNHSGFPGGPCAGAREAYFYITAVVRALSEWNGDLYA